MIQKIRTSKVSKIIACYLALMIILQIVAPMHAYALTEGPSQPEFNSFTPVGTSDMVDLSSGDLNYNIPIMDVGGYPLNLSYSSGVTMDQEASWVGLGWNLNVGQINHQVRGLPDDFKGDEIRYENNAKKNQTVGATIAIHPAVFGADIPIQLTLGMGVTYNNYTGFSFKTTNGFSYQMSDNISVGVSMDNSSSEGVTVSPSATLSEKQSGDDSAAKLSSNVGASFNSRQGLTNYGFGSTFNKDDRTIGFSAKKSFLKTDYTPSRRIGYLNKSFSFNASIGFEVWGGEGQGEIYAYASTQEIKDSEKNKLVKSYGYENTEVATKHDILDFNRENERAVSKYSTTLPITNYTYDQYSIQGQGISGSFRAHKGQVGYVFDSYTSDESTDLDAGIEIGPGAYFHGAAEIRYSPSTSFTGLWENNNNARSNFIAAASSPGTVTDYEKVYFRSEGETDVDKEYSLLTNQLGGEEPIRIGLSGSSTNKSSIYGKYRKGAQEATTYTDAFQKIKRTNRITRNQAIQKITKADFDKYYSGYTTANKPIINSLAKAHHTVGMRVLQPDGSLYIYDQPVYNTSKVEATFNVSGNTKDTAKELVNYGGSDNSPANSKGTDHYFNRVTTPAYAHTYLITEILSPDYEDVDYNDPNTRGASDNDLGNYTKFRYVRKSTNYKWRLPFERNKATLNEGLYTLEKDAMGNYVYGEKELIYIDKIETKTHVAIFTLTPRLDGYGVLDENGGINTNTSSASYKIDKISLYTKAEYALLQQYLADGDSSNDNLVTPIKVANFEYDYSLQGAGAATIPNNSNSQASGFNDGGKLTLKKVYFTYRGSNMGKYTPYQFAYESLNASYDIKGYDMWGNYKPTAGTGIDVTQEPTTAEYPYVNQSDQTSANSNASAWTLTSITLPSGGKLKVSYESDDYAYVQDKEAMEMFKVRGVGDNAQQTSGTFSTQLYDTNGGDKRYMYVELPNEPSTLSPADFKQKYLESIKNDPLYFRFLVNMAGNKYDYVTGYFKIDLDRYNLITIFGNGGKTYASIPMQFLDIKSGNETDSGVNPVSKAGWFFARTYLNRIAYGQSEFENFDVEFIVNNIISQVENIYAIFKGPDGFLRDQKSCAKHFSSKKSWIRLKTPDGKKLGGGCRVNKVEISDNWEVMTGNEASADLNRYAAKYGQEYKYTSRDGKSSGVASYEPYGGKENPFIMPFEDHEYKRILAPTDQNYVEKPLGSTLFPSAKVTYSRVEVRNITPAPMTVGQETKTVKKHATGKTVYEYYTSKDFPTIAKNTVIEMDGNQDNMTISLIQSLFNLKVNTKKHLALSQGFMVITNDMDGKMKSTTVYPESELDSNFNIQNFDNYISKEEYRYNTDGSGKLKNKIPVIDEKGVISEKTVGVDYEIVNDFRTSKSELDTYGKDLNLGVIPGPFGIPIPIPKGKPTQAHHEEEMRMAVTVKTIHKTGILLEKKVHDLGAEVITTNLAWDANTGNVLLTEVTNEFNDRYYNFNFPAYWMYRGMDKASRNLDMEVVLGVPSAGQYTFANAGQYLQNGDEVWGGLSGTERLWVTQLNVAGANKFKLMKRDGSFFTTTVPTIKIIRSGFRNNQLTSMANITLQKNPIRDTGGVLKASIQNTDFTASSTTRIMDAAAIEFSDTWNAQCECEAPTDANALYNPYVYNMNGNWRAKKSYTYLTTRAALGDAVTNPNPRNAGYYSTFTPFYKLNSTNTGWQQDATNWTFTSEISQFSIHGNEIENKDALNRYTAAQFGFNKNLPVAVSANSQYKEMGYDGFEDYAFAGCSDHFSFKNALAEGTVTQTDAESHTGKYSYNVGPSSNATLNKAITVCSQGSPGELLIALINKLSIMHQNNDPLILAGQPFTIPELQALTPYIVLPSPYTGTQPKISNFIVWPSTTGNPALKSMGFNFFNDPTMSSPSNMADPSNQRHIVTRGYNGYQNLAQITGAWWGFYYQIGGQPQINPPAQMTISSTWSSYGYHNRNLFHRYIDFGNLNCLDCTSFSPLRGQTYWLSAWVKEKETNATVPSTTLTLQQSQALQYTASSILLRFESANYTMLAQPEFVPTGEIVDGWQRIVGKFTVPSTTTVMRIQLRNQGSSTTQAYFDDVRIHPFNGSMKSYAYDAATLRLMAELDDNNYATFYEYDREGRLVRTKKETSKGVMTIKESRSSNPRVAIQ